MALRISSSVTLPVTVTSAERSFSKLNIIKNFMQSTMTQDRLIAVLSIESEVTRKIDFTDIIDMFAMKKARKGAFQLSNRIKAHTHQTRFGKAPRFFRFQNY